MEYQSTELELKSDLSNSDDDDGGDDAVSGGASTQTSITNSKWESEKGYDGDKNY